MFLFLGGDGEIGEFLDMFIASGCIQSRRGANLRHLLQLREERFIRVNKPYNFVFHVFWG
jgi:hypothetical protein